MGASKERRAATAQRRAQLVAMRLAGVDFETIARQLEYSSRQAAAKDLDRAMQAYLAEQERNTELLVLTEILRLDRLQRGHWHQAISGDVKSADIVLKVHDRRARLLRLYELKDDGTEGASVIGRLMQALGVIDGQLGDLSLDADQDDDHTDPYADPPAAIEGPPNG